MARKERNNVDYFPHSVSHGKKMFYLRDKFGNDGYAVWFMLLEQLGKAEYHYLDLSDEIEIMYLSSEFKVAEKTLKDIIEILVRFGEFDKELWENDNILFNEKFNENISDAYKKRNNNIVTKKTLILLLSSKGRSLSSKSTPKLDKCTLKGYGSTQSKVKYTKVKKSKVKKSKEYKNIPLSELKNSEAFKNDNYFKIALSFQELFIQNLKSANASTKRIENAKGKWIDDIRLIIENDGYQIEQLQKIYAFLQDDEFWKTNILSTSKLREKMEKLLMQIKFKNNEKIKHRNQSVTNEEIIDIVNAHFK